MKSLRKSILTLLALTLFGGAGAWAQGPQVTQFTTGLIADWQGVNSNVTLADMQALGFVAVDENTAMAWTGAPQGNSAWLIYSFNEGDGNGNINIIMFNNGTADDHSGQGSFAKGGFYDLIASGTNFFYTTGGGAIELTKEGANQWTLGQAPDYDLELQVEYYEAHALKNIPAGWTVKVNGVEQPKPYQGDSLMITETDSVTLVPAGNPRRVKSVTLEEPLLSINVSGHKIYYLPGESWEQAIMNHTENTGWSISNSRVFFDEVGILSYDDSPYNDVDSGDEIDPNRPCSLGA